MNLRFCLLIVSFTLIAIVRSQTTLTIDPSKSYQVIEGFGASDCWTVNYVGKFWKQEEKEKAAKWLFSSSFDKNGNPKGIGLSIWRFNIGGGTVEQGDSSHISDLTRRAECFINSEGQYNWTKQAGQQWFLEKAKSYGCKSFVAFSNTPPVFLTRNGYGHGLKDGNANLKTEKYAAYASFLVDVANYFDKKKNIKFDYISPVNEPQWNWDGTYQEGSPWQNYEIKKIVVELDRKLIEKKCNSSILISEAGTWEKLSKPAGRASNQIFNFFDAKGESEMLKINNLNRIIAGHSYWTDTDNKRLKQIRDSVWLKAKQYNVKVHQTEWSLLSVPPIDDFPKSYEEATYTDIALQMAKIIYADLAYANASTWSFWTSMDVEMNGFKNRFNLIRLQTKNNQTKTIEGGGKVLAMKNLWVLGNYSLFVRPGYKRINISGADNLSGLMGISFISPNGKKIVTVLTNNSTKPIDVELELPKSIKSNIFNIKSYLTDKNSNLKYTDITKTKSLNLPFKSVSTIIYELK
jgi:O-glycosyl hydrolase